MRHWYLQSIHFLRFQKLEQPLETGECKQRQNETKHTSKFILHCGLENKDKCSTQAFEIPYKLKMPKHSLIQLLSGRALTLSLHLHLFLPLDLH